MIYETYVNARPHHAICLFGSSLFVTAIFLYRRVNLFSAVRGLNRHLTTFIKKKDVRLVKCQQ